MLEVFCYYHGEVLNITNLVKSVNEQCSIGDVSKQVDFTMIYNDRVKLVAGHQVWTKVDGAGQFSGEIVNDGVRDGNEITYSVFDFSYRLNKTKRSFKLKSTAEEETKNILLDNGAKVGYIYPTGIAITKLLTQKTPYETIMSMYTDVSKQTGEKFYMWSDYNNNINIYKLNQHQSKFLISESSKETPNGNLLNIETNEDKSNMVNMVEVTDDNGNIVETFKDEDLINDYGVYCDQYKKEEDKDYRIVAKNMLHGIDHTFSLTVIGNVDYYVGCKAKIYYPKEPLLDTTNGEYATVYITSYNHTWDIPTGSFTTQLEVTLNEIMDEHELEDETEKESTSSGSSSGSGSNSEIVEFAKTLLGLKYVYGGTSPTSGMDCSGFTQYVYNHFGYSIGRTTYDQVKSGKAVSKTDSSKWKEGDLIFNPSCGHVVMYIGNNQVIHEPQTGDVCKISNLWFTPSAVRRIID